MALRPNSCLICGDQIALLQRAAFESDLLVRDLQSIQERLTNQLNEKANELQRSVQDANKYQMQLLDSSLEITLLNNELSNVLPRLHEYEQAWQKQQHKMKLYRESANDNISKCAYLTERFKEKIEELEEAKSTVKTLQQKIDSVVGNNAKLSAELIAVKAESDLMCDELDKMRVEKQESQHRLKEQMILLQTENATLSADFSASQKRIQGYEDCLNEKNAKLREKEDELEVMRLSLLELQLRQHQVLNKKNATTLAEQKEAKTKSKTSKKVLRHEIMKQLSDLKRDVTQSCNKVDNIIAWEDSAI